MSVLEQLIFYFDLTGTVIFAITGAVSAVKLRLDLLGVVVFGCTVGVGGGMLRDAIIGATPVAALQNEVYLIACIVTGVLIFFISPLLAHHREIIMFCDAFGLPVVTLVNSCGLEVSADMEDNAYAAELAKLAYAYTGADNAKVTAVVGKAYGAAFTLLGSKAQGADMVYALPGAAISVLSPEASVAFVWNDKVGQEKSRAELEAEWKEKCASAADAADRGEIDDIVESVELRQRICAALMMLATKADGKPARRHANMPL